MTISQFHPKCRLSILPLPSRKSNRVFVFIVTPSAINTTSFFLLVHFRIVGFRSEHLTDVVSKVVRCVSVDIGINDWTELPIANRINNYIKVSWSSVLICLKIQRKGRIRLLITMKRSRDRSRGRSPLVFLINTCTNTQYIYISSTGVRPSVSAETHWTSHVEFQVLMSSQKNLEPNSIFPEAEDNNDGDATVGLNEMSQ